MGRDQHEPIDAGAIRPRPAARSIVKAIVPPPLRRGTRRLARRAHAMLSPEQRFATPAWSTEGEDLVLRRLFWGRRDGFYVDVGAHHPMRGSNTCLFHHLGWRGINIDATPGSMAAFRRHRTRDINLELAISDQPDPVTFHLFNDAALNGFEERSDLTADPALPYRLIGRCTVACRRLDAVLNEHLPAGQTIDFLNVDVEGQDLAVLHSSDWTRFRPEVVLTEDRGRDLGASADGAIARFLDGHGYAMIAKTMSTLLFRRAA